MKISLKLLFISAVGAIAIMGLLGYLPGMGLFGSIREDYIPMAPSSGSVLDVGCGTGDDVVNLYEMVGPEGRVVGIDYSAHLIVEAKARVEKAGMPVELYVGDAHELTQFGDNCFDATRSAAVFHHLESPEKALQAMIRVTKPGGSVVIAENSF